jgi:hypothetical protein
MNSIISSHQRSRRRAEIGRPAVLFVAAVAVAAGCGFEPSSNDANRIGAVEAARGSDRHLELLAQEIADNSLEARIRAASGSDRHLELQAQEIADTND